MNKNIMVDWQPPLLVLKLWLVLLPVIITVTNPDVTATYDEHAKKKLEADASGFINIDCGASESYKDDETGLVYEPDKNYIETGENHKISPNFNDWGNHKQPRHTLRSFPQGIRNCYALKPKQGGNSNYLIRAIFKYRNYDGKNKTPEFQLNLGVNIWSYVRGYDILIMEITHVFSTEYIDVCLVNTGNGVPHISVLELRPLDKSIYAIPNGALLTVHTVDVGGKYDYTRYPVDVYDRLWLPLSLNYGTNTSTASNIDTQSFDDSYKVPERVLNTSYTSTNASLPLEYVIRRSFDSDSQYYVYFHFAEIEKFNDGNNREICINLNGQRNLSDCKILEYLTPWTIASNDVPIDGTYLYLSIYAAEGCDIPPILNAFEVYKLLELQLLPTNLEDVNAIKDIKSSYKVTRNWQGDPCIPTYLSWIGLQCSNDTIPRITSLNLSSSKLAGDIESSFSSFQAIIVLDLSYNSLKGQVPEFLAQLPNLKVLNLTGNKFTGSVPAALIQKSKKGTLLLSLEENPGLCLSVSCHEQKKFIIPIVASVIGVVLLILFVLVVLVLYKRKRKRGMATGSKKDSSLKSKNQPFTYHDIVSITDNFKTVIGEGGFGKIYYGTLKDETKVAVKMLSPSSRQGHKEFRAEAELLMMVYHKNLVSLAGYCDDQENKALIYEYMVNGNLGQHILGTDTNTLSWMDRLQIAVDAAHGLDYLHNGCKPPIIHRDLKPSNILLTEKMQAKIADFGLSRVFNEEMNSQTTTCPAGTPGYLDPEIHVGGVSNKKSDIYSFGIILFELITGQPAIKRGLRGNIHILEWVTPEIERGDIQNVVDSRLQGEFNTNAAWKIVDTAMSCVKPMAVQRSDINNVLIELKACLAVEVASRRNWRTESSNTTTSYLIEETFLNDNIEMVPSAR